MLVEDEPLLIRSLARHIKQQDAGFKVVCEASNGAIALELLEQHAIHLIISDIRMPVMEGLELLEKVSARYPLIEVVLLSGHSDFSYAQQALRNNALDYLLKPLTPIALENMLINAKKALSANFMLKDDLNLLGGDAKKSLDLARQYLEDHYSENIDLGNLSARLGFSSPYLTKLFHKYEDCSPVKFLTNLRINAARNLLINTNLSIKEVGERVGYPDQFYFSNVFRKAMGKSPSAFRRDSTTLS